MSKILVLEDNEEQSSFILELLKGERYLVDLVTDGDSADVQLKCMEYDLLILDWQTPNLSGIEVCRRYRARGGKSPVIMLTAKMSEVDKETGLDAGADDYLTKPYSLKELLARIRAHLRRSSNYQGQVLSARGIAMDLKSLIVTKDGAEVSLLPKEFALLEFFMRNPDQVFSSEALMARVWDSESESSTNALRTTMRRLRQKLGEDSDESVIENVHGVGYRFRTTSKK
ncbi:MAG TPA: response regulator transcription factor [Oculatellaceae cyanobacterium]